ncbi:unnamed protein product [Urochloa humidicola]
MEPFASSPPSPPGAPPTTSLTPDSTPEPAATHSAIPANPATPAPGAIPPTHPPPAGRSKEQRWCDNSPKSSLSGESVAAPPTRRSYRDVVGISVSAAAQPEPRSPAVASPPPRIILRPSARIPPPPRRVRDADGWEQVESRAQRRIRVEISNRPRRPVPADLRGLCFNCFSGEHRAAQCRSQTRCFKCRTLGHRSSACPRLVPNAVRARKPATLPISKRVTVWRRITPTGEQLQAGMSQTMAPSGLVSEMGVASDVPRAAESGAQPPDPARGGRRRRRPRHRRRHGTTGNDPTGPDFPNTQNTAAGNRWDASPTPLAPDDGVPPAHGPPCIIDWSAQLTRAEAELRRAVIVTVVGEIEGIAISQPKEIVANSFVLNTESMEFRRSSRDHTFIIFVEDEATITRLTNAGPTPGPGGLQLHCLRWSRHAFAEGDALPVLAKVELRGIPAHAWEMSTAESLLSPFGWPHLLHSETRNREDYSMFRLSAWCFKPSEIPRARVLHIVEPSIGEVLIPPGKLTLKYPVTIHVEEIRQAELELGAQAFSASDGEGDNGNRRRQRRWAASPRAPGAAAAGAAAVRTSVGDRLGLDVSGERHVVRPVEAEGSSSQATGIEPPTIDDAVTGLTVPEIEEATPVPEVANGAPALETEEGQDDSISTPQLGHTDLLGPLEESLGLLVGCSPLRLEETNVQAFSEKEQDPLPSMESPTLVSFEVPNSDPFTEHDEQQEDPASNKNQVQEDSVAVSLATPNTEELQSPSIEQTPPITNLLKPASYSIQSPVHVAASPVNWRPAEEVLPAEPLTGYNLSREMTKVYARRLKQKDTEPPLVCASPPRTPAPAPTVSSFYEQITKTLDTALPIPMVKQRRRQVQIGTEPPRRSRRIANLPPENHNPAATSVCRELGFTDENSKVTPAMVKKYEAFFKLPLERKHVKLMATMLHKELPDEIPTRGAGAIIVA